MYIIKVSLFLLFTTYSAICQTPANFEANYLDAKEKAQQSKKICAVIFTEDNNKSAAYTTSVCLEDGNVKNQLSQNYVGVISDVNDFDGQILMKRWQLSKAPSIALVNSTGKIVASVNHGLSKAKMAEFLQFYSQEGNAGKSIDLQDDVFISEVSQWQGYKGRIEEAPMVINDTKEEFTDTENASISKSARTQDTKTIVEKSVPQSKEEKDQSKQMVQKEEIKPAIQQQEDVIASRAPSATGTTDKWVVQAGVFSSEVNARSLANKINANGGNGSVEMINQGDKNVYKVVAGKFVTEAQARDLITKLGVAGIQAFIKEIN